LVRRRAIAALGEYMFYAATQLDDEMADPIWELSDDAIDIIVRSLDSMEPDRTVRFYACKTLENICA
jgi:serine/threonine-protein kinase ULK4